MTLKNIIIGAVILFIGVGIGTSGKTTTITKEVPVEKIVEKQVTVTAPEWAQLKTVDDKGFVIAGENMTLCSQGFKAVANLDTAEITRVATEVKANTATLNDLAIQRQELLKKLGY